MELTISDYRTQIEFPEPMLVTITFKPPSANTVFDFQAVSDGIKIMPMDSYSDIYFKYDDNWFYTIRLMSSICTVKTTKLLPV